MAQIAWVRELAARVQAQGPPNMFGVKRSAALAAILSILAVSSTASAGNTETTTIKPSNVADADAHPGNGYARDIYAADSGSRGFETAQGFVKDVGKPTAWAMLIVGFAHL